MKTIESRKYMYEVDPESAWRKLTSLQFAGEHAALFREPVANARDASDPPNETVRVDFNEDDSLGGKSYRITNSAKRGLKLCEIEALHYIGRSTKNGVEDSVGRFGVGFLAAFNRTFGLSTIQIQCEVDGVPVVITIATKDGQLPLWWWRLDKSPRPSETSVEYFFEDRKDSFKPTFDLFLEEIDFPLTVDGVNSQNLRTIVVDQGDIALSMDDDHGSSISYVQRGDYSGECDKIRVFIRGFLVESGSIYRFVRGATGDKMAQNYYGEPFVLNEELLVRSNDLSVTLGRERVVRDDAYHKLLERLEELRARSLVERITREAAPHGGRRRTGSHELLLGNLVSLRQQIGEFLEQADNDTNDGWSALLGLLCDEPLFSSADRVGPDQFLSVRQIVEASKGSKLVVYSFLSDAAAWSGVRWGNLVHLLEEELISDCFGNHTKALISDILSPILGTQGIKVVHLMDVKKNPGKYVEVIESGKIQVEVPLFKQATRDSIPHTKGALLKRLDELFAENWASKITGSTRLGGFRVSFIPLGDHDDGWQELARAMPSSNADVCLIGLRMGHRWVEWASLLERGELLLVPGILGSLCKENQERYRFVAENGTEMAWDDSIRFSGLKIHQVSESLRDAYLEYLIAGGSGGAPLVPPDIVDV